MLIERSAKDALETALSIFPSVALLGPRQVGKTTLAKSLTAFTGDTPPEYFDLENPADRAQVTTDPLSFFRTHAQVPIILDEIHRTPDIFPVLRGVIDERREKGLNTGQFLFLGSASLDLLRQSSESLAGRIGYVELAGFSALEIAHSDLATQMPTETLLDRLWLRGGFPDSFLATSDETSFAWRQAFVRSYIERDIHLFGLRAPSETISRLFTMVAHLQGAILNTSHIASGLGMSSPSIARYIGFLEDLLLIRTLKPLTRNIGKRLVKSPKIYFRDSGIVHSLLGIHTMRDLLSHPIVDTSYEGFVLENIIAAAGSDAQISFYRTAAGAEIDVVVERGQEVIAIEIKRSLAPRVSQGFLNGCSDIRATKRLFVYPGERQFSLGHDTTAIPVADIATVLATR